MNRKLILPLVLLVLLVAVAVPGMARRNAQAQAHRSAPVVVLPTYGNFHYFAPRPLGNLLSLQLVSGADALDPAQLQVDFPGNDLTAKVADCVPAYTHDGYTLWALDLEMTLEPGIERCTVEQIILNGETYPLGRLDVQYLPQIGPTGETDAEPHLALCSHLGMGVGRGLAQNYQASFRNDADTPLTLTEVSDPSYDGAPLELRVNGQPVSPDLPLGLEPGDYLDVTMALDRWDEAEKSGYELYYISPTLHYADQTQGYAMPLLPCPIGFSLTPEEFDAVCGEYRAA